MKISHMKQRRYIIIIPMQNIFNESKELKKSPYKQQFQKHQKQRIDKQQSYQHGEVQVRVMATKFIEYLNQLNSSIQACKAKVNKKTIYSEDKNGDDKSSNSGSEFVDNQSNRGGSRRSNRSSQRKRASKDLTNMSNNFHIIQCQKLNGKIHGRTILQLQNGSIFKGFFQEGESRQGTMTFLNGIQYEGGVKNFVFHGEGKLKLKNGSSIIGNFAEGVINQGEIKYENGDYYKGKIRNFKKHGFGQLKFKNNNRYVGDFYDGQITGYGKYFINQFPTAIGYWERGQYRGRCNSMTEEGNSKQQ